MSKKLSIVITHYNEPISVCRKLFESLYSQRQIDKDDIEIIVVQDGKTENQIPSSWHYGYEMNVCELPKCGVSACRNKGIDLADGEYVMFCDCDDMFHSLFGLYLILTAIKEQPDFITSTFIEENCYVADYKLIAHDNDRTFIHGKAFRKAFLVDNGIRFHEDITKHEDSIFVCLSAMLAKTTKTIQTPFYLWCWNKDSVMRKDVRNAVLLSYKELMDSRIRFFEDLKAHGLESELPEWVARTVFNSYYDFNKPSFNENRIDRRNAMLAFKKLYVQYESEYKKCSAEQLAKLMQAARTNALNNGFIIECMTLQQFLNAIKDTVVR